MTFISAVACIGVLGATASGAFASATNFPAAGLPLDFGTPPPGSVPASCPSVLATGDANVVFQTGTAVLYGPVSGTSSGGNVQGIAIFYEGTTPMYEGHTQAWFGGDANAQGEMYFGQTLSFQGTALDGSGSTVTVTASGGDTIAAHDNHESSWGHVKASCS
jgi:hypothetical protein